MKFLAQMYQQSQSDWFGKRGISWHISVVYRHIIGELQSRGFIHLIQYCSQDHHSARVNLTLHRPSSAKIMQDVTIHQQPFLLAPLLRNQLVSKWKASTLVIHRVERRQIEWRQQQQRTTYECMLMREMTLWMSNRWKRPGFPMEKSKAYVSLQLSVWRNIIWLLASLKYQE